MKLKKLEHKLTVCKVADINDVDTGKDFYFIGKTDEEISLVCKTDDTPQKTTERDDGWRGFRIQGVLDFSLIAISTFNTDYILVKAENFEKALKVLSDAEYDIV